MTRFRCSSLLVIQYAVHWKELRKNASTQNKVVQTLQRSKKKIIGCCCSFVCLSFVLSDERNKTARPFGTSAAEVHYRFALNRNCFARFFLFIHRAVTNASESNRKMTVFRLLRAHKPCNQPRQCVLPEF